MADHLYPLYIVYRPDGRAYVRCVHRGHAAHYAAKLGNGSMIKLEPRDHAHELNASADERARIDAAYASGIETATQAEIDAEQAEARAVFNR